MDNGTCLGELVDTGRVGNFPSSHIRLLGNEEQWSSHAAKKGSLRGESTVQSNLLIGAMEALGQVDKQEKMDKLTKFFGVKSEVIKQSSSPKSPTSEKKEKNAKIQVLKNQVKELDGKVKEYEYKYIQTKMVLSRTQADNLELQKQVQELRRKLGQLKG